uniref:Uronate isomerase n=1 Tax=Escherichia coli TaxID=562 RepID=A0A2R8FGF4_ECOLX|nr:Uronate isomerase [Escherichia coli]
MAAFMTEDFLLKNEMGRRLYHDWAADMPIYDFHCHLNPKEIALNKQFNNLTQIWLAGDHYKWRAMRSAGVEESLITGSASDYDKFLAWSNTVPKTIGNPLYHWTHLELRRPFGITGILLSPDSAEKVWYECNEKLMTPEFSARGIMQQMNVRMVGTTDDPLDDLEYHKQISQDDSFDIEVAPSWRPDKVFKIELEGFVDYLSQLEQVADVTINSFNDLLTALTRRWIILILMDAGHPIMV